MSKKIIVALLWVIAVVFAVIYSIAHAEIEQPVVITPPPVIDPLTHRQHVWLGALEWCESHGNPEAINPNDKDNTPSYYSFQFKPDTFRGYGEKYQLIPKGKTQADILVLMKDYPLTLDIMEHMVIDPDITATQWRRSLFPGCVAKLGLPPKI